MSSYSDDNDYQTILDRLLAQVDDNLDKREGSIIYDALAPAAAELAQCYIALDVYNDQSFLATATGENLDVRVADFGLTRNAATYAQRYLEVYDSNSELMDIDLGTRFSTPNSYGGYAFSVIEKLTIGNYIVQCETAGIVGNEYLGEVLPLVSLNNLGTANLKDVYTSGVDEESDDELRKRCIQKITQESFAGNKSAYRTYCEGLSNVSRARIYPCADGTPGKVGISVLGVNDTALNILATSKIQHTIDPENRKGYGEGIAPIGHKVYVMPAQLLEYPISATLTMKSGYTADQVKDEITTNLKKYFKEVQEQWAEAETLTIYISRVSAAILEVSNITNVTDVKIDGSASDAEVSLSSWGSAIYPILGEVTLSES